MLKDTDYRLAHSHETFMGGKPLGIRIYIATGNDKPTEDEQRAAWNVGEDMFKAIWKLQVQNDEEMKVRAAKEKAEILALFDKPIFVEEIPNGYCNDPCCCLLPWFVVTTTAGRITIGWRKRVINIDWTDSIQKKKPDELFPEENTTKGAKYEEKRYIHAWGYEKAKEYLDIIQKC